jgi:hypothetical protein
MRRAVLLLGLALAACATTEAEPGAETRGTNTPTTTETAPPPTVEPEPEPEPEVPSVLPFGDTWTYEDGLVLTVSAPEPFEPSEYAAGHEAFPNHLVFEVRIVNGTDAPFDPSGVYASVQSGNVEGSEIYDESLIGPPQTTLLPGREAVWRTGWAVADPADLVLEITPSFEHESAIFQGGVS